MRIVNYLHQKKWAIVFVIYLRYLIGGAMVFSSLIKIKGGRFTSEDGISAPINSAWHLFETLYQSGLYWKFLGWSQLITGMLLMTQLFATLGAVALFPIVLNIFIITISYYFAFTPLITGLLLLASIFLLLWDYQKFSPFFRASSPQINYSVFANTKIEFNKLWCRLGLVLFLFTVIYVLLFERSPVYWFLTSISAGLVGLVLYNRQQNNLEKHR